VAKLIFGCGYLGKRVARLWRQRGERVIAVTRTPATAAQLAADGIEPLIANLADLGSLASLAQPEPISTVLFAVGFDRSAGQAIRDVFVDGLARAIYSLGDRHRLERFIYISSTGVYGQTGGEIVDEGSLCYPVGAGGQACLAAEQILQRSLLSTRAIILRLAGLYGPDRVPRAKELQSGKPTAAPSHGHLNLIHVDDAANIVLLAEERATPPKVYCVSDGQPVVRGEYYAELARLTGSPPPKFIDPPPDSPAAKRAESDKRVSNALLMKELAPQLQFPSYREGLRDILVLRQP
jgi:nucleoside-diphosphate-sugar epimerase